jgi:hypothetical protein
MLREKIVRVTLNRQGSQTRGAFLEPRYKLITLSGAASVLVDEEALYAGTLITQRQADALAEIPNIDLTIHA